VDVNVGDRAFDGDAEEDLVGVRVTGRVAVGLSVGLRVTDQELRLPLKVLLDVKLGLAVKVRDGTLQVELSVGASVSVGVGVT